MLCYLQSYDIKYTVPSCDSQPPLISETTGGNKSSGDWSTQEARKMIRTSYPSSTTCCIFLGAQKRVANVENETTVAEDIILNIYK